MNGHPESREIAIHFVATPSERIEVTYESTKS